jgi:hypothetical protein
VAHKAIEALGDRFVIIRGDSTVWREEAALQAIGNAGSETMMRTELAQAMGALVASANLNVRRLDGAESKRLTKVANLVTRARSAVERDYRGGVIKAHDLEMPTRFAKQLAMVARGAMSIGVPANEAMKLAIRCARDSIEPLRLQLLLDVAAHPASNPENVRKRTGTLINTTKNTLDALYALHLLDRGDRIERHGSRVFQVPYYTLASRIDRVALLSL